MSQNKHTGVRVSLYSYFRYSLPFIEQKQEFARFLPVRQLQPMLIYITVDILVRSRYLL